MRRAPLSGQAPPDACPGALQVHTAADGPLARIRVPGGALTPLQLRELAACAGTLGTGVVELTSRANVQVRGLRSPSEFAARMADADLLPSATHERVRNIAASPLAGRGPSGLVDTDPLVASLDRALCARAALADLSGRFLFAVDDGTGDMTGLGADVTFVPARGAASGTVLLAGVDTGLATAGPVPLMIAAAEGFLAERDAQDGSAWRVADLDDGPARIAARLAHPRPAVTPHPDVTPHEGAPRAGAGPLPQRDGRVALEVVVPLGRLTVPQAEALAAVPAAPDGPALRLTPWRTVVVLDLTAARADEVARVLAGTGLVCDPASPWAGVSACTGRPGCAKALADVRHDVTRWVSGRTGPGGPPVHWSGCERRCGLPRGPVLQYVATGTGYRVEEPAVTQDTGHRVEESVIQERQR
ncbi:precorrin-3B synthase [Sphaerisporangium aureirubrum]|uniref:Precorrin-3B synthase n=1 Tax=Sphaerisporangium aureirubrum TaxID=1544736 RepID=A0ABW1NFF6_9ACTN